MNSNTIDFKDNKIFLNGKQLNCIKSVEYENKNNFDELTIKLRCIDGLDLIGLSKYLNSCRRLGHCYASVGLEKIGVYSE